MTAATDVNEDGIRQICKCWTVAMSVSVNNETEALYGKLNADAFIDKMYLSEKLILELAGRGPKLPSTDSFGQTKTSA